MQPSRRLAVATAATLLVLLTAGCGGDEPSGSDRPASSPADATSVQPAEVTGPIEAKAFVAGLLTAIDAESTVHLTFEGVSLGSAEVDVAYGPKATDTKIYVDAEDPQRGPAVYVIVHGAAYIQQEVGGKYLMLDRNDPTYGRLFRSYANFGPHQSVAGLGRGITSVVAEGTATVEGRTLDRYAVEADPAQATGALKALAGTTAGLAREPLMFTFYVDDRGRPARVEVKVSGERTTVDLNDWSKPVSIAVPTRAQLVGIS